MVPKKTLFTLIPSYYIYTLYVNIIENYRIIYMHGWIQVLMGVEVIQFLGSS